MFDKKEKPLQEVFFKEEILGRTKEKVFQEKEMEIPQEKAIQRKDFQTLHCMQKTRTFCKKLPKERKGSKAS